MSKDSKQSQNKASRHDADEMKRQAKGGEVLDNVQEAEEEQNKSEAKRS